MEHDATYQAYVNARRRLYIDLDSIRADVDGWLAKYANEQPRISELAHFQGLIERRSDVLRQLEAAEAQFVTHVLELMKATSLHKPPA